MKFLKSAFICAWLAVFAMATAQEGSYDHETLTTVEGRVYREIFVIGSDDEGLTFRHRDGIAKIGFASLSPSYQMLYAPAGELPSGEEASPEGEARMSAAEAIGESVPDTAQEVFPQWIRTNNHFTLILPQFRCDLGGRAVPYYSNSAWPGSWANHHAIHRLSDPLYRDLVLHNFLHATGLLP